MSDDTPWVFDGFTPPEYTGIPNIFFDEIAPRLKEGELRVMLYLMRRTFGFHKHEDRVSIAQFCDGITTRDGRRLDHGTGMSKPGVRKALDGCVAKGLVTMTQEQSENGEYQTNLYALRMRQGVGNEIAHPGQRRYRGVGNDVTPQKTVQKTANKKGDLLKLLDEPLEPKPRKGLDRETMARRMGR